MHATKIPILVLLLGLFFGCTNSKTTSELSAIQGNWRFDESRYLESLRAHYTDPNEFKKFAELYDFAKKNGTPVMTDIKISGSSITTSGGLVRQQYDLSDVRTDNGRITAKALWHEDRNDPGDASTIDVVLQSDGTNLLFTTKDEDSEEAYNFKRK
jgi:hypothetical protein